MTAPGVGSLVALAYISLIDAPERFSKSSSVGTDSRHEIVDQKIRRLAE